MPKPVVDTDAIYPEEIPAELLERVQANHPNLHEVGMQVMRSSKWAAMKIGHRTWSTQPPEHSVHDICVYLVNCAKRDVEVNGEGQRYRARMVCRQGQGSPYTRYAFVRGEMDSDGALRIIDDDANGSGANDPLRVLLEAKQRSDEISFRALEAMEKTVTGYAAIATAFTAMMTSAGEAYAKSVGGQADLLKVQIELEQNQHHHTEKMAKFDKGFGLLEGPVTKVGDEIVETILHTMKQKRQGATPKNGRPRPGGNVRQTCGFAVTLDEVFQSLDADALGKLEALMSPDEWKLIQAARKATDEAIFDNLFGRFYAELRKRDTPEDDKGTDKWIASVHAIVGDEGIQALGTLIQRVEMKRRRDRQADAAAST